MIQIEEIEIVDFRGIRYLKQQLSRKSFGIAGPNGTGKSGIVDAIEFALTGTITRLSGAGTGELSVKAHAPHVDANKSPEKAVVRLKVFVPSLKRTLAIERCVKSSAAAVVTPDTQEARSLLAKLETHPEFALSRREIIKYILTPAGDRSKDVQALLRLGQIEKVRLSLQRVANDAKRDAKAAVEADTRAKSDFFKHLGHQSPKKSDLLNAVNERRSLLSLSPVADLAPANALKDGVSTPPASTSPPKPSKASLTIDLKAYRECLSSVSDAKLTEGVAAAISILGQLTSDPELLKAIKRKSLVDQGIELLDDDVCPLCDTTWDMAALSRHLQEKLAKAETASAALKNLTAALESSRNYLETLASTSRNIANWCGRADPKIDAAALDALAKSATDDATLITKASSDPSAYAEALVILGRITQDASAGVTSAVSSLDAYVLTLPDPSKEEAAREFLIVAQEKYDRCREAQALIATTADAATKASAVFERYAEVSTKTLEGVYDQVQKDFTEFYSFINREDEAKFEGRLTPSVGKLAFDVDFYGRGKFPPGAYHSEGHQDGMGLCLYLALVKHTLGEGFTLAVLDDVLMSVDTGHRREVCALLKQKFPGTQFILTTHDPVWLRFMKSEQLIQSSLSFGGWTVDTGPQVWTEGDVWKRIDEQLAQNDVPSAAATLRRYLEFISTTLADNFQARVQYHANGQYDLHDLWSPVTSAWKDRLQEAAKSASSWGKNTDETQALVSEAKAKIAATNSDQWMINKSVHYDAWHTLQPQEFATVAASYKALLASMQCSNKDCREFVSVTPSRGDREALRCSCGGVNLNLLLKSGK